MKNISRFVSLPAMLMATLGCEPHTSSKNSVITFPESYEITGKLSEEIPILSQGNVNLLVIDTFLVIQRKEEPFFLVYSTISSRHIGSFGKSGDGPSEFRSPYLSKQCGYNYEGDPLITIYDRSLIRITQASILHLTSDKELIQGESLDTGDEYIQHFYYKNEDFLLSTTENGGRFSLRNFRSGASKVIPYLPKTSFKINEEFLYSIYRSAVMVNEKKGLFAAAPIFLGQLDFFELDGNYVKTTYFESSDQLKNIFANLNQKTTPYESKMYVVDMDAKGEYIYGLSYDNLYDEYTNPNIATNSKLLVFDWDGNPVKELVLNDGRYIMSFAVDEKNKRVYAYCPNEKENNLVVFSMP
jgi:hypothetical protein